MKISFYHSPPKIKFLFTTEDLHRDICAALFQNKVYLFPFIPIAGIMSNNRWPDQQMVYPQYVILISNTNKTTNACSTSVWWLLLCVNLITKQNPGWTIHFGVPVRKFPDGLRFDLVDWGKQIALNRCGWASFNPLRTWIQQKGRGRLSMLSA